MSKLTLATRFSQHPSATTCYKVLLVGIPSPHPKLLQLRPWWGTLPPAAFSYITHFGYTSSFFDLLPSWLLLLVHLSLAPPCSSYGLVQLAGLLLSGPFQMPLATLFLISTVNFLHHTEGQSWLFLLFIHSTHVFLDRPQIHSLKHSNSSVTYLMAESDMICISFRLHFFFKVS